MASECSRPCGGGGRAAARGDGSRNPAFCVAVSAARTLSYMLLREFPIRSGTRSGGQVDSECCRNGWRQLACQHGAHAVIRSCPHTADPLWLSAGTLKIQCQGSGPAHRFSSTLSSRRPSGQCTRKRCSSCGRRSASPASASTYTSAINTHRPADNQGLCHPGRCY